MRRLDLDTPEAMRGLYEPPLGSIPGRVIYGGRNGLKSWGAADALLLHGMERPLRILCAREFQSSIRDSVHRLLCDQIHRLGLEGLYRPERDRIFGVNGTEFLFKGLRRDINEIKSTEGIDLCWVEEAQSVSHDSWEVLIPTIRKAHSELWVTFNPGEPTDPTWQLFVVKPPEGFKVWKTSYLDNPWLSERSRQQAEQLKRRDPDGYAHVWLGEPWQQSELQVFAGKYHVMDFTPLDRWGPPLFGLDFGFAHDPSILVKLFVFDSRLYIAAEAGGVQLDMDDLARAIGGVPDARDHLIRADAARPETINELKRRGFKVQAAPKWDGSVKDGIEYLRAQFEDIIVHPSCATVIEEMRLYRYKADPRTGDPLPKVIDAHNHGIDAIRYALSPLIKRGRPNFVWYPGMEPSPA